MARKRKKITIIAGNHREILVYDPITIADPPATRAAKSRVSSEARKTINNRTKRKKLELLLYTNFTNKDLFITLTFSPDQEPRTIKEAEKKLKAFIRLWRDNRAQRGEPLKYIYTTEGKHGDKNIHFHIIANQSRGNDLEDIKSLWIYCEPQGIDIERLAAGDTAGRKYSEIAEYMTKEDKPNGKRSFTCSLNIERPRKVYEWINENETIVLPSEARQIERRERACEWGSYTYISYDITEPRAPYLWKHGPQ